MNVLLKKKKNNLKFKNNPYVRIYVLGAASNFVKKKYFRT